MSTSVGESSGTASGEIMLFGVRLVVDSMRKSVSLNNLSQYAHPQDALVPASADKDVAAGYASADESAAGVLNRSPSSLGASNRERKRGVPWTEDEHKLFLLGLQKVGKGDWRGISKTFVKTRTPTQVASHAQKYFLRRCNLNRRRRRSSLFDITTETVSGNQATDQNASKVNLTSESPQPHTSVQGTSSEISNISFSVTPMVSPAGIGQYMPEMNPNNISNLIQSTPSVPAFSTTMTDFNPNNNSAIQPSPISLNLSLSLSPTYQAVPSFSNGDSMISVA